MDLFEVLEHAAVELDVIGVAEIGHDVVPEAGSKHERVGPVSTGQPVVAVAADQTVTTTASEQEIIAAPAIESLPLNRGINFVVAFAIDLLPPPALAKRGHGSLARRFISVRWGAVFVVAEGQCPHP